MELPQINRRVELGVSAAELWRLISTGDGWREWLVDGADVHVATGAGGVVRDADRLRDVRVHAVDDERRVTFSWHDHDDPASTSVVQLEIVDDGNGGVALEIAETLATGALDAEAHLAWEVRVGSLWACTVAAAMV